MNTSTFKKAVQQKKTKETQGLELHEPQKMPVKNLPDLDVRRAEKTILHIST
jgi:hypothetical protein